MEPSGLDESALRRIVRRSEIAGDFLARVCDAVAIALIALFTTTIIISVFFRYVIGDAITWSEELARFTMVAMVFVAASPAIRYGEHVAIDLLATALSHRGQAAIALLASVLMAGFALVLTVEGIRLMIATAAQTTPSLGVSRAIPYSAIPLGSLLMIAQLAILMVRHTAELISGSADAGRRES